MLSSVSAGTFVHTQGSEATPITQENWFCNTRASHLVCSAPVSLFPAVREWKGFLGSKDQSPWAGNNIYTSLISVLYKATPFISSHKGCLAPSPRKCALQRGRGQWGNVRWWTLLKAPQGSFGGNCHPDWIGHLAVSSRWHFGKHPHLTAWAQHDSLITAQHNLFLCFMNTYCMFYYVSGHTWKVPEKTMIW
jgi:hypothetical protein